MRKQLNAIDRRQCLQGAMGLAAAAALAGGLPRPLAAAEAHELNILFPGGSWQTWYEQVFATPFAKEHGTKIVWKTGLNFEPLVILQRRRPQWDLVHENQNTSSQMGALKAVIEWKADRIPNLPKINPVFRYPYLAGKVHTPYGLAVNTKHYTKPVDSWKAMWDPAFRGKVGFPEWSWVGEEVFHAMNVVFGGTAENIDPGIKQMAILFKQNKAVIINNVEHAKDLLVRDEVWICPNFGARTEQAAKAGAPVEFVIPKEGGLSWIWNTSIIAGRPADSTALAEQLVNDTLDAEKQIAFCRLTGYPPTNMEAMKNLPADLKKLEYSDAQIEQLGKLQRRFDYMAQFAHRDRNRERWETEVLGS